VTVDRLIADLIDREGGYVDDPVDRGGPTHMGITLATLQQWRAPLPVTRADVMALTREEATAIYRARYVDGPGFREAIRDDRLLALVVDYGVLSGPEAATKALQRAIGIHDDGVLGPQTRRVLVSQAGSTEVYKRLLADRIGHHVELVLTNPSQRRFLRGWLSRCVSFL
jgi:lysozyme family protein